MADQKTPAEVAAEKILAHVERHIGLVRSEQLSIVAAAWTAIIAQATLDACEQAAPRVRAEERERGMRRAARYAAGWHWDARAMFNDDSFALRELAATRTAAQRRNAHEKAALKCDRIAEGKPAFTTPRAFRGRS